MLLRELIRSFDSRIDLAQLPNAPLAGVKEDSRQILPGDLFVARSGTRADGSAFLADARRRGAIAAVVRSVDDHCPLPQIVTGDTAAAASRLANLFYSRPSTSLQVLGITGTNGKTTTAYLTRHVLRKAGLNCGMIGTVQIDDGRNQGEAEMTTPSATDIARLLATMRDNGCSACAMEVSSHALDQGRVAAVDFAGAVFTNLTGDHLDYHKTLENYAAAKAKLFESLPASAVAMVNEADASTPRMVRDCRARIVRFGFSPAADYRAENVRIDASGTRFMLRTCNGSVAVSMGLIGKHNVENALGAAALAGEVMGISLGRIAAALGDAAGAPGRLQAVRAGQPFAVLIDYAHTDDALANVLSALRPLTRGKLRVLFGCGGDRDKTKRPRMAAVAQKMADVVYVTSDNPRTEMPLAIITDIVAGFTPDFVPRAIVEPDRRTAIERILADAKNDDVVLIAGKGHENYQILGTVKHHFDDVEESLRVLGSPRRAA
ncbi:MAG TPA: UDP-N-acetylmuramoyl-L-alanyl-D-glutamate--2,6-diaminopimelate ligase [Tepidisphaeraceae bacterium]|nr:UDP-N-acetylmuramoyl-L-alanyl-D-glutamate--2,6-diaminopimelate ligase [Tepidisphaeraceae bacterium]